MAVTVAENETDVTTNEACEIIFFISHASFYLYCHCALLASDSNFLKKFQIELPEVDIVV